MTVNYSIANRWQQAECIDCQRPFNRLLRSTAERCLKCRDRIAAMARRHRELSPEHRDATIKARRVARIANMRKKRCVRCHNPFPARSTMQQPVELCPECALGGYPAALQIREHHMLHENSLPSWRSMRR